MDEDFQARASEPIELEPIRFVRQPRLPGSIVLRESEDAVLDALGAELLLHAKGCVRAFGDFHLALSATPGNEVFFRRLMYDPLLRDFPWARTHLWIVDEACVGFESPLSRFTPIREYIVDNSDIPPEQVHPIFPTGDSPASEYQARFQETLAWREKGHDRLDFVMLGLETSGATLGMYPGSESLAAGESLVAWVGRGGAARQARSDEALARPGALEVPGVVTMTPKLINAARFIVALMLGARWSPLVRALSRRGGDTGGEPGDGATEKDRPSVADSEHPSAPAAETLRSWLRPTGGELRWYMDYAAAG
ncbi:MAG: 6-phosphogluconolactonase [Planctomycetota bacterium]|nr:6-phosphogluconolactonase [Planctomycetota bacterium]